MATKLAANLKRVNADGTTQLFARIQAGGIRGNINTGIYINVKDWDTKNHRVINRKGSKQGLFINTEITKVCEAIDKLRAEYKDLGTIKLRFETVWLNKQKDIKNEVIAFWDFWEYWKGYAGNTTKDKHKRKGTTYSNVLKAYDPFCTYESWTSDYCHELFNYLISNDRTDATAREYFKIFKVVMKLARKKGYPVPIDLDDFVIKDYDLPQPILTMQEVDKIAAFEANPNWPISKRRTWEIVRDRFVFRAHTGIREGDHKSVTEANYLNRPTGPELQFIAQKTGKLTIIDLTNKADAILKQHNYSLGNIVQQTENGIIKPICKLVGITRPFEKIWYEGGNRKSKIVPICNVVGTHTARRSFGRHFIESGGDILELQEIYGHGDLKQTYKYIGSRPRRTGRSVRDIFNQPAQPA